METQQQTVVESLLSKQFTQLLDHEPKIVTNFIPEKAAEQRRNFIEGDARTPNHRYPKLEAIDFDAEFEAIVGIGNDIADNPDLNPKFQAVYAEFVDGYMAKTRLMQLANLYKTTVDPTEKSRVKEEYMSLNIELYGKPDEATYRSLLGEKLKSISEKTLDDSAAKLRDELFAYVDFDPEMNIPERFKPSDETVEWMHDAVHDLYDGMLNHVPDQSSFTRYEVRAIFESVLMEEFGDAAEGWTVDIEPAKDINVKVVEKRIVIPDNKEDLSSDKVKNLIAHEIGIHVLRSIMGEQTDLEPLRIGLSDYYDSEEGLGMVVGQALKKEAKESGTKHYITAGLAYFDNMDFRDIYEIKWRLEALDKADKETGHIDDESMAAAKITGHGGAMRSMRGTDELPLFKDLAYYNGSVDVWRYLEEIRGDDLKFTFLLLGKANAANINHERILYETRTA